MVHNLKRKIIALFLVITILISAFPLSSIVLALDTTDCTECDGTTDCDVCGNKVDCDECDNDEITCETCETTTDECIYSVVSPVGYGTIEMITQADRLDTLEGKNIALVGGSFNASITHAEIKKCILEEYPTANVYVLSEIGSGGVYSPKKPSNQSKNFQNKLQELNIDAVVSGNCGCGLCTVKETGSSIAAEYIGIPSVTVGAHSFVAEIKSTGINRGVPVLRTADYPGAFSSDTKEELQKNAREILYPQIKEGLLTPISDTEIQNGQQKETPYNEIVYSGCYNCVQEYFEMNQWTDGTPIVPPTDAKIQEYLKYSPYKRADATVVSSIAPSYRKCTNYIVAANAVMAGCPEEYMPICIAFVKCLADKDFAQTLSSTHAWTPYAWLNGPVARQLGLDTKTISEEESKSLAKFIELSMLNIAGYYIKDNRMGTYGYLTPWVFSEDEKACLDIGWEPYHVTQGMELNQNTITAGSALQYGNNMSVNTTDSESIKDLVAWDITEKEQNGLGTTNPQVYRTIFTTKAVAENLSKKYTSKESFEEALIETSRRPLWFRAYANYWGNTGSIQSLRKTIKDQYDKLLADENEQANETNTPIWLKNIVPDEKIVTIATMNKGQTPILVTGEDTSSKVQVIPGGAYKTIEIVLPDNWDTLMEEKGYKPLNKFYLDGSNEEYIKGGKYTSKDYDCNDISCDECGIVNCSYSVVSPVDNSKKVVYDGCYDCIQEYFDRNNWKDSSPIVPPTVDKVEEYLKYTSNKDAYQIAVNAVMAGCPEEYMPICVAFTKALDDNDFVNEITSIDGFTPYAWINGPIARQLEIDHCQGMISEENNRALARFIELAMKNIKGIERNDTFGGTAPFVFSEDEEKCVEVGWTPYHVANGMKMNSNAITVSAGLSWGNSVTPATDNPEEIMKLMAWDITEKQESALGTTNPQTSRTLFITDPVAQDLVKKYDTKESFEDALVNTARRPAWYRAFASYYGSNKNNSTSLQEEYNRILNDPNEKAEETEIPAWFKNLVPNQDTMMTVPTMSKGKNAILVTGDISRNKFQTTPSVGYKTIEIELPSNWNALMAEKGYEKLSTYYLDKSEVEPEVPEIPEEKFTSNVYQIEENYISKIAPKTTFSEFMKNVETNQEVVITDKNGNNIEKDAILVTGIIVKIGSTSQYTIIVKGDVNQDGNADFEDILQINKHRLGKEKLEEINLIAGDINEDGNADFEDILQINKYRLGKIDNL